MDRVINIVPEPMKLEHARGALNLDKVPSDSLSIVEIFSTIEGEGRFAGQPRIFVRVAGCLVGCHTCDSIHTWDALAKGNRLLTIPEIVAEVEAQNKTGTFKVVTITGGEPMHFPGQIEALADQLHALGYTINLETSGFFFREDAFAFADILSIDVKTPSSGVPSTKAHWSELNTTVITRGVLDKQTVIKAVVGHRSDLTYLMDHLPELITHIHPGSAAIYLTPCSSKRSELRDTVSMIMDYFTVYGWPEHVFVLPQMHYMLKFR